MIKNHIPRAGIPALASCVSLLLGACGGGGGASNPPPAPVDTTPPDTTLAGAPAALTSANFATFTFTATESATFEARLDGAAFAAAASPQVLNNLADGSHTLEVRARDTAGNVDATPATVTWIVDTTPPDTQITAAPSNVTVVNAATFTLSASEPGSTFEASVDGAPFVAVANPHNVAGAADGTRTIAFRARDPAGNVDATPATASWNLDATPPDVRLNFPTRVFYTDAATVTFRGTAQDARGVTALSINGVAAQTSDAFAHWHAVVPVPLGSTTASITSSDGLGNSRAVDAATMVNRGPVINAAHGIGYDGARDRVILVDRSTSAVLTMKRSDGIVQMLSPGSMPEVSPGPVLQDVVIDAAHDRALIIDALNDQLIAVDLANGARSILSAGTGGGAVTRINNAAYLALDAVGQRAYASVWMGSGITATIVRIDLTTGVRNVVSSATVGSGAALINPQGTVYDSVSNPAAPRLLVATADDDVAARGIMAVDLATGDRTGFSTASTGSGTPLRGPYGMVMDAVGQRVIVEDGIVSLVAVSLLNGDRAPLNVNRPSTGFLSSSGHLAFDPVARRLFEPLTTGGVVEVDIAAQASRVLIGSNLGLPKGVSNEIGLAIEQTTGTPSSLLLVGGGTLGRALRLDLATGDAVTVSSFGSVGTGPALIDPVDLVLDRRPAALGRAALVLLDAPTSDPRIASVDLITGDRTVVVDAPAGTFNKLQKRMALDVANNRIFFTNNRMAGLGADELYALDLTSGNISSISDASHGVPYFGNVGHIVLEPAASPTRALVSETDQPRILAIDLATGTRSVFDTFLNGRGGALFVDAVHSRLLVTNAEAPSNLVSLPLEGGTRLLISGSDPVSGVIRGAGPAQFAVSGIDVDVANDVAYVVSGGNNSVMAIDVQSGDRVIIAR